MTSYDNAVLIREDVFNARMDAFLSEIKLENEKLRNELRTKIQSVAAQVQVNTAKIEMLKYTLYCGFAILAFIAAFVPLFKRERKENH